MTTENVIVTHDLRKVYPRAFSLEVFARSLFRSPFKTTGKVALDGITLSVPKGQVLGILGVNGAGKSTLLRILAGTARQTSGTVFIKGQVLAILQVATGLLDDLTGRANIRHVGALYGMSDTEIARKEAGIIAFADIGAFIDQPVRTYSAGMRARLAFSIVTSVDCDVLLIDEALAVGDVGFALTCRQRVRELCRRGLTVIVVSHSTTAIRELCERAVVIDAGKIIADGAPAEVVEEYRLSSLRRAELEFSSRFKKLRSNAGQEIISIDRLEIKDKTRGAAGLVAVGADIAIEARIVSATEKSNIAAQIELTRVDGVLIVKERHQFETLPAGPHAIKISFGELRIGRYAYEARLSFFDDGGATIGEAIATFAVYDQHHTYNSTYYQPIRWRMDAELEITR